MEPYPPLASLSSDERRRFCRQVVESLSDLVEGTAPQALQVRVEELLGGARGFHVLCDTLREVVRLAGECGQDAAAVIDERAYRACVARVRDRLGERPHAVDM